mmetsp:Transcript_8657/g.20363  ORF Transcript_8657/g.20363 Transcript_8657/m.20363 type:complete len:254 (-) Transcript_8657:13-774(-)
MFFDHFSADCTEECPEESVVEHGQCVREETVDEPVELEITGKLEIECGVPCWHDRKLASLHDVRLSVAGDLDIPFQEVEVSMGFASSESGRRLTENREAYLTVRVISNRVPEEEGTQLLEQFVRNTDFLTQLLGLKVLAATIVPTPDGQFLDEPVKLDQETDPYVPAYLDLEPAPVPAPAPPASTLSFLPTPAIIGIAVGAVVIISVILASLFWRRRRAQRAANNQRAEAKAADVEKPNSQSAGNAAPASNGN